LLKQSLERVKGIEPSFRFTSLKSLFYVKYGLFLDFLTPTFVTMSCDYAL